MERIIFLDRDGTLINEPADNFQVDSFEKLALKPFVIQALLKLQTVGYVLVIVTNQDGMGTSSFPAEKFWPPHNLLMQILESQGIQIRDVFIDNSFETDNSTNRKPGIGMLTKYLQGNYDLRNSWVIGDRITDVEMARRLNCSAALYSDKSFAEHEIEYVQQGTLKIKSSNWLEIVDAIIGSNYIYLERNTNETSVKVELYPAMSQIREIKTGIGFFDHMLDQFFFHSCIGCRIYCKGDLHVDTHHTIEDIGLVLGEALQKLWRGKYCNRYGFVVPMDDALAMVALDFSGRPWLSWNVDLRSYEVGGCPAQIFKHFFYSLSISGMLTLHITAQGENDHHTIEAVFKAFGRAFRQALGFDAILTEVGSTKGIT